MDRHHDRDRRAGRSASSGTRSSSPRPTRRWRTSGTSPSTRFSTSGSSCCFARGRARSGARSGSTGSRRRWQRRRSALRSSSSSSLEGTEGSTSTVVTNLAYPLGDVLLLSAVFGVFSLTGGRPGRRWLLLGLGVLSTALADSIYLFQSAEGTYVEGTWIDILWPTALLLIASSAWMPDRTREGLEVEGRPLLAVPAVVRARRHRDPRLRPLHPREPAGDRPRLGNARARRRPARRDVPREQPPLRADARGGDDRCADRPRQPPAAAQRPRTAPRRRRRCSRRSSCSSTSTASRATTTRSAIRPATRSSRGWARSSLPFPGASGAAYRLGGDEFCLLAAVGEGEAEPLIDRACDALTERGEGFEIETSFGAIMLPDEATDSSHALQIADERLYAQKYSRRGEGDRTMAALLEALSVRDPELQEQLAGVGALAGDIGTNARAPPRRARRARPRSPAPRPRQARGSRRDPLEARAARRARVGVRPPAHDRRRAHPARVARLRSVATIVRASHENWDGSGYPDGLAGEDIPLASRIIRACNAFVAMTSHRPYREALSVDEALNELMRRAGADFDPTVVRVLVARVRDEQRSRASRVARRGHTEPPEAP